MRGASFRSPGSCWSHCPSSWFSAAGAGGTGTGWCEGAQLIGELKSARDRRPDEEAASGRLPVGRAQHCVAGRADPDPVSYTHLRAHETDSYLVCRLLLEKKKKY